jgi:hypothetical protein
MSEPTKTETLQALVDMALIEAATILLAEPPHVGVDLAEPESDITTLCAFTFPEPAADWGEIVFLSWGLNAP